MLEAISCGLMLVRHVHPMLVIATLNFFHVQRYLPPFTVEITFFTSSKRALAFLPMKCWATLYQYSSGMLRWTQAALICSSHSPTGGSFLELPLKTGPSFHSASTGSRSKGFILNASSIEFIVTAVRVVW